MLPRRSDSTRKVDTRPIATSPSSGAPARGKAAGIKTFLIADVRGYTTFTQTRGDEAAAELATVFADVARAVIEGGGGELIQLRGDEALAVFDSARQAIRTAIDLQTRFVEQTIGDPRLPLAVGIGLDAGEAVAVDDGFRGGALNLAARLCGLADAGEVLLTREVSHLARKVEGVVYLERGPVRVKGLDEPVQVIMARPEHEDIAQDLAFRRALGTVAPRPGTLDARNPYKGLRAFEESDAGDFFGREQLTRHLVERLADARFLGVVGPSGSGKSSVVRAGLVPALRTGALAGSETWTIVEMFPGTEPLEELEAALLRVAENPPASLMEQLSSDERGLVRAVKRVLPPGDSELLLVLDQLEEVFTLVADESARTHFLSVIERAVMDPRSRLRVVATLRADFYDRPLLYSGFAELLRDYVEALVPLAGEEFEHAITGPAERVGVSLEPGLLSEMLSDVASEPGALPLLQYALTELFERREGNLLTRAAYEAIGGVSGALAGRAENVFLALTPEGQEAARQLFLRLVTLGEGVEDTRRRVQRDELNAMEVDQEALEHVIQALGASRLLSFDRDPRTGSPTVEVAHEALLREWGRLRRWIDSAREDVRMHRRLAAATNEWDESERDASFLMRGSNLAQFETWAEESLVALTAAEREYVAASAEASTQERLREQRQNRRLKALLGGAVVLLLLAIAAGIVALLQRQSAKHEATVALARQLGAQSVIEPRIDRSMLLAREAINLDGSTQTQGALLSTLLRSPAAIGTFSFPIEARPLAATATPDGRTLAVTDNQEEMRFFDTRTHKEVHAPLKPAGGFDILGYSSDGSQLFTSGGAAGKLPGLEFLDARTRKVLHRMPLPRRLILDPTTPIVPYELTPDGKTFFLAWALLTPDGRDGAAFLERWNVRSGKNTTTPLGSNGIIGLAVVRDGRELVTVTDSEITTRDARTLRVLRSVPQPVSLDPHPPSVGISPDGRTVAYGDANGSVSFLDLASGRLTTGAGAHNGGINRIEFSPDGREVVTTGDDARVIVWDPRTAQPVEVLEGHGGRVTGLAFSRDSHTLFTTSLDGVVFAWDLGTQRRFGRPFSAGYASPLLEGGDYGPPPLAVSPDGSRFAVRGGPSSVLLISTRTLRPVARVRVDAGGQLIGLAWSRDEVLATTGADGHVQVWDVRRTPRLLRELKGLGSINGEDEVVTTAAFSPDGRLLAAGDINHTPGSTPYRYGTAAAWDVRSGKLLWKERTKYGWITAVPFSPDGKTLATAREDGTVSIRDSRTGRVDRVLRVLGAKRRPGGDFTYLTAAFAPDGTLATGIWAGIVQLWDPRSGAELGHPTLVTAAPVAALSFAPDGKTFATTGGSDGVTKLWTTETQQQFGASLPGSAGQWGTAAYTRDGNNVIAVYGDGRGFVWPASTAAWKRHACAVAGRNFTREEWSRYVGGRAYAGVCPAQQ